MPAIDTYKKIQLTLSSAIHRGNVRVCKKQGEPPKGERPEGTSEEKCQGACPTPGTHCSLPNPAFVLSHSSFSGFVTAGT